MTTLKRKTPGDDWMSKNQTLPDSIEEIEAGRPLKQRTFFDGPQDNGKAGRLARLLGKVPGLKPGAELEGAKL
jgi:hypothetical protein